MDKEVKDIRGTQPTLSDFMEHQSMRLSVPRFLYTKEPERIMVEGQKKFRLGGNNRRKKK